MTPYSKMQPFGQNWRSRSASIVEIAGRRYERTYSLTQMSTYV